MSWQRVPLKDLGQWYGGGTPSKANSSFWQGGSIPWLSPKDMGPTTLVSTQDHITPEAVSGSSVKTVPGGSVAVVVRSGILERTLPIALVPFETTLNQDMKAVLPREDIDARWIAWGLRAYERELLRDTRKAGTTVASIEMPRFHSFELPVPSLGEQRRIVDILEDHLSRLDAAAHGLASSRSRLVALGRSALDQHFGQGASKVPLHQLVADISAGKSFGLSSVPATLDEWGIIKVSAMTWGEFDPTENKAVPADRVDPRFEIRGGDLLVSRANTIEYVGASVFVRNVRPHLLLSDKSLRVTPQEGVSREWLWRALQAPSARRQISALATGTKDSMRNISQASLREVRLPHVSPAQQHEAVREFGGVDDAIKRLTTVVDAQSVRTQALRRTVLAAAFSGKLTGRHMDEEVIEELVEA